MRELALYAAVLAGWFVLARWVLPFFGIATCCGGACQVERQAPTDQENSQEAKQ